MVQCEICGEEVSEEQIAAHFEACFADHCPVEPPPFVPQQSLTDDPQAALFGTAAPYTPGPGVDSVLSHLGPTDYGRLSQTNLGWRHATRTTRHLRVWHQRKLQQLLQQLPHGSLGTGCSCSSLLRALPDDASRKACGAAAARLERGLALEEATVEIKSLTNRRISFLVKSNRRGSGVLWEATVGDLYVAVQDSFGHPVEQVELLCGSTALVHLDAPLIAYVSSRHIQLEMTLRSRRVSSWPCIREAAQRFSDRQSSASVRRLEPLLATLVVQTPRLQAQLRARDAEVAGLQAQLRERDAELARLQAQLREKDAAVAGI